MMVPGFPFKIFLVPRKNGGVFEEVVRFKTFPGFPEISSHLMLIDEDEWNEMTVNEVWETWRERMSIDDDNEWNDILKECSMMDM